ncbi:PREDICTED: RNA/RNP complex-1-interacting phosphatase-like [Priapulus caudatus]|uniref:RNA/RNP complex-1-interacting phosphatase-like n=1 Tax=Priapulus caudatus TaxID=37621 RepID=A0ABM1ENP3_PRICU|nr:PREDICTED: RNA/RNP complex-1-interacting phosphatase-like [Priapulus caudatus]
MGRIPDRWEAYSEFGKIIAGTRFLPLKVPLKEELCMQVSDELWFTPACLQKKVADLEGRCLGLVIDLTNTTRYYDYREFTYNNVDYVKIFCEGHVVPSSNVVRQFYEAIDNFQRKSHSKDSVIAVHCTHGVNRTGYLVCRYMIERLSVAPTDAIKGRSTHAAPQ